MIERAVDIVAVSVQLPAAVLADEASGAAAIASVAQRTDAAAFVLTIRAPFAWMNEASLGSRGCARHYKSLK
jgi:hypothetical protein